MRKAAITGVVALGALTACGSATHTATVPSSSSPTQAAPTDSTSSFPDTGTTDGSLLACNTVVAPDPSIDGLKGSNLTAEQIIGYLIAATLSDGGNIGTGNPGSATVTILFAGVESLQNYNGGQLATDAAQFVQDATSYGGPAMQGPYDTSYASAMTQDITALTKDCPGAGNVAKQVLAGKVP